MFRSIYRRVFLLVVFLPVYSYAGQAVEFIDAADPSLGKLPFSEAVRVGDTLYLSGQIGVKPGSLSLVEGGMAAQARQTMQNIRATLKNQNLGMEHIVKCTVMMADMSQWAVFNEVYVSFFHGALPARSAFGANGLGLGAELEVECIAVYPQ